MLYMSSISLKSRPWTSERLSPISLFEVVRKSCRGWSLERNRHGWRRSNDLIVALYAAKRIAGARKFVQERGEGDLDEALAEVREKRKELEGEVENLAGLANGHDVGDYRWPY